jgi:hypothetical protein
VRSSHQDVHVTYDQLLHLAALPATGSEMMPPQTMSPGHTTRVLSDVREARLELNSKTDEHQRSATALRWCSSNRIAQVA